MAAVELPVANLVACVIQLRDDPSTAALDREHPVARPVGDEHGRLASAGRRRHEPRREGDHAREKVPVGEAEGERVGGPVGEARYRQPLRVKRQTVERPLQRPVDELDIRAVAAEVRSLGIKAALLGARPPPRVSRLLGRDGAWVSAGFMPSVMGESLKPLTTR